MVLELSKNVHVWIFGDRAHSLDLHLPVAFQAEAVEADAVFQGIDELLDLLAEIVQGSGV